MKIVRRLVPTSLKNRLFAAFLMLILIPYSLLQLRNFHTIQSTFERNVSSQNKYQLEQLKTSFEELKGTVLKTVFQMEKDPRIRLVLQRESAATTADRLEIVTDKFRDMKNDLQQPDAAVYFTLTDLQGSVYTSYKTTRGISNEKIARDRQLEDMLRSDTAYMWAAGKDEVHSVVSGRSTLLTFYSLFKDAADLPYGFIRVSIDCEEWLKNSVKNFSVLQSFFIVNSEGVVLARSNQGLAIDSERLLELLSQQTDAEYATDVNRSVIIIGLRIPSMDWYLVSQFPLDLFFGNLKEMNRQFFATFLLLTLVFILITFFILSTITRPLRLLHIKMSEMVAKNFKLRIPTAKYKGEMLTLAETFNKMAGDISELVERIKVEERQKEALRFQMLQQQMNPHFLLNTLNTIKWNALSKGDRETAEMCVSLGKLLEASLNSETELIYLRDELDLIRAYAYIQTFRFDQKFEVRYECGEGLRYALVPKLSLQPLVENAICHGFSQMNESGLITIRAYDDEGRLIIEVEDNGIGIEKAALHRSPRKRKPLGLHNVRERLKLMFQQEGELELIPLQRGTMARMRFPLLISPPYRDGGESDVERAAR